MSFARPFSEAHEIQQSIQLQKTDGKDGGATSPVKNGASTPGTSEAAPISEMNSRRTKMKTGTSGMRRSWF